MSEQNKIDDYVAELRNAYNNVKVFSVVPMGVVMILYFFTFATLFDRGMYGLLFFEIATTLIFLYAIITINRWPMLVVKWRYRNKEPYNEMLSFIEYGDFTQSVEFVVEKLEKRRHDSVIT